MAQFQQLLSSAVRALHRENPSLVEDLQKLFGKIAKIQEEDILTFYGTIRTIQEAMPSEKVLALTNNLIEALEARARYLLELHEDFEETPAYEKQFEMIFR